jgi:hypothetical protein
VSIDDLNDHADDKEGSRANDGDFAPILIGQWIDKESNYERSDLLQAHRKRWDLGLVLATVAKVLLEGLVAQYPTSNS